MTSKIPTTSLAEDAERMRLAVELIKFNPRLPLLVAETGLSRERLTRLYRQEVGCSPPKGQLPSSLEWFMPWLRNIHGALYLNYFNFLRNEGGASRARALMDAYLLYLEHTNEEAGPIIGFNRAWTLVRYLDGNVVKLASCRKCQCKLLLRVHQRDEAFVCPMCAPPNRSTPDAAIACFATVPLMNDGPLGESATLAQDEQATLLAQQEYAALSACET